MENKKQVVFDMEKAGVQIGIAVVENGKIIERIPVGIKLEDWNEEELKNAFNTISAKIEEFKTNIENS